jgi:general nucleoside transport system permease protein
MGTPGARLCDGIRVHYLWASLLFGGAQALGPALQSVEGTSYYYLFNASPFILTLAVMILTWSNKRSLSGVPGALTDRS